MKSERVTLTGLAVAAIILGFFFLPLPVTRVREIGLVQVSPEDLVNVSVEVPGILKKINVREGEFVFKGKVLAEFTSQDMENRLEEARAQEFIKDNLVTLYDSQIRSSRDDRERQGLKEAQAKAKGDQAAAEVNRLEIQRTMEKLVLRAPRDGVVMGLPRPDEVGKSWDKEQAVPFCSIGDPTKLRVLVPLAPGEYDLVLDNLKKLGGNQKLGVTLRIQGRGKHTWHGHVSHTPESEAKTIPISLSSKGGGPLAVKPSSDPNQVMPQSQVYLVGIAIEDPDRAICPGSLAQVKIHCQYRSAAWWTWRTIHATFDLGLL